ncbi:hypothetical protein [Microvirga sp. VF16]|uniref:hypothetical protein n=1 Tax=Microvirga sp. VF16 TaxID=2807101 RepID=UPI00193DF4DC|nr:hypothetical protein [Microvirga sp. VF16]QRM27373.1 hypothetical protein JO965_13795 [Microvirga sp. VF16]
MTDYTTVGFARHRKTAPESKLTNLGHAVSGNATVNSRVVIKLAAKHGLSLALARTIAELASFRLEVGDER